MNYSTQKWQLVKILPLLLLSSNLFGQTGPAGVGTSATNIIWLDANALTLANGAQVSTFADLSGNTNNFTQPVSTKRPVFTTSAVNGLPAIDFDGVDDVLNSGSIVALQSANITYFIVFQRSLMLTQSLISSKYADYTSEKWSTLSTTASNSLYSRHFSPNSTTQHHCSYVDAGAFTFISNHIIPANQKQYHQGTLTQTKVAAYTVPGAHQKTTIGNLSHPHGQNHSLNGYIAEVVVYNAALTPLQRIMVENYLGAKYNMAVPTDFYAYQATHNIGLVGVGNDGSTSQTSAKGAGVLQISGPTAMASGEYLLSAHTNDALSLFSNSDLPVTLPAHQRWTRTWMADETGEVGNVTLTYYLTGGNNFGASGTYVLLVDNVTQNGDFTDATEVLGVYDGGLQTITFTTNINDGDIFTLAGADQSLEIHAINDGVWSDINTWDCLCVPGANDDVYIDANVDVTVDVNAEVNYFSIGDPGGNLIMNSNLNLSIYGNWDLLGSVQLTDGSITMAGSVDQYIDAGGTVVSFNDLIINNSGGGTITLYESEYHLTGTLTPINGNFTLDGSVNNKFIIESTSALGGARIAEVPGGFNISGNFTVQRFLPGGIADLRNISSPVTGATLMQWDPDIYISGTGFPDGCAVGGGGCYFSAKRYNHSIYYNVTNINEVMLPGFSYEIFIGDDLTTFNGATLESTGTINNGGDVSLTLTTGWTLVGNPFASPILYSACTRTSQISNYFYIYDAAIGDYQWYDGITSTASTPELLSGLMATGQGAYIYVSSLGTLKFHESAKTASNAMFFRGAAEINSALTLKLIENGSTYFSTIQVEEITEATDKLDSLFDILQLRTGIEKAPEFSIVADESHLRKNYISDDHRNKSFDLYIDILNAGYYTIEASNIENFNSYRKVLLFDNQTGQFVDLKSELSYTFYSEVTSGHRFTLILSNELIAEEATIQSLTTNEVLENGLSITQMGHTFNIVSSEDFTEGSQIKLVNLLGQQEVFFQSVKLVGGSNMITVPEDIDGVHILVITTGDKIVTKKVVL